MTDSTSSSLPLSPALRLEALRRVHDAARVARRTPVVSVSSLADRMGRGVLLKAECLQRTGSFKVRGALNKTAILAGRSQGVVAGSAGNHGQALAYAARLRGLPCVIYMPEGASVAKMEAVAAQGAEVRCEGDSVDDCVARAQAHAQAEGLDLVHPFEDIDIIAGQAGVGLEIAEDVPDVDQVVVPVGGGGLAAGVGVALRQMRPHVRIVGVQAARCASLVRGAGGERPDVAPASATIADGIAVKSTGPLTGRLLRTLLDDVVTVEEDEIAGAMLLLLSRGKLLVEGAGAAGVAAALAGRLPAGARRTVIVLSGGNVDLSLLSMLAARHESLAGRRVRIAVRIGDRPGDLAAMLAVVAAAGANVLSVDHVRDGLSLGVIETGVVLTLQTRGSGHDRRVTRALIDAGYAVDGAAAPRAAHAA